MVLEMGDKTGIDSGANSGFGLGSRGQISMDTGTLKRNMVLLRWVDNSNLGNKNGVPFQRLLKRG